MAFRNSGKTKLSKGILEMKFMKKSKDKAMAEMREEEGRLHFGNQVIEGMNSAIGNYIMEPSYVPCEGLIDGRLSFLGMNPEIERLMELEELAKQQPVDRSMKTDISDVEMANFQQSLVQTVASKFKTKKSKQKYNNKNSKLQSECSTPTKQEYQPRKKAKFLKPVE